MIEVTAWSPTRAIGLAFMEAVGIAKLDENGKIQPLVNVQISADDWIVPGVDGWHVNVRYYGATADALMQGGDPSSPDLFDRAPGLLAITELRTGEPMNWVALSDDPVPPGYENSNGVRLYDPSLIATRANYWA
jgi:hypothetical protein